MKRTHSGPLLGRLSATRYVYLLVVLGLGVVLSWTLSIAAKRWESDRARVEVERSAVHDVAAFEIAVQNSLQALQALGAFYAASTEVTRFDFHVFANHLLTHHTGVQALEWIPRIPATQRDAFEAVVRGEGFPDFQITEQDSQGNLTHAGPRDEYFPVSFLEPYAGNEAAHGYDLASNPSRREALNKARDTGDLVATSRIRLIQERGEESGVLVVEPIYGSGARTDSLEARRANLQGFVLGALRPKDLLEAALPPEHRHDLEFFLSDESAVPAEPLASLRSDSPEASVASFLDGQLALPPGWHYGGAVDVADRTWRLLCVPGASYETSGPLWTSWTVLLTGLLFTGLVVAHLGLVFVRSAQAERYMAEKLEGKMALEQEVTVRAQTEHALRESEERYRTLVDAAFEGFVVSVEGTVVEVNKAFAETLGYSIEELIGLDLTELVAPDHRREVLDKLRSNYERPYETVCLKKDGTRFPVEVCGKLIPYQGGAARIAAIRDISARKRMEEDLVRSEKLESLGILAGGLAHDFNNLLTAILGNISLARMSVSGDSETGECLLQAEKASMRAQDLTRQLLTFSSGGAPIRTPSSISEIVRESASFALRGSNVRCEFQIPADLWPVEVDRGQMSQVIHNLVMNADQAMPRGGTIELSCSNVTVAPSGSSQGGDGLYVKISVTDQGVGIPLEHLRNIFDPYFTTKQHGSGLGLASAYSVIKNHDGWIDVESEPGVGSKFHVYVPASSVESPEEQLPEDRPVSGTGRLLVMDDNEVVRNTATAILRHLGYEVEVTDSGEGALKLYRQAMGSGAPFEAVIMDLTIPGGMGGRQALERLLEIDRGAKVIVSSGYSHDPVMANFKAYGFTACVAKPYKVQELSETLRSVLTEEISPTG